MKQKIRNSKQHFLIIGGTKGLGAELAKKYGYSSELVKKDSWKDKLQLMPPMFTSLKNI